LGEMDNRSGIGPALSHRPLPKQEVCSAILPLIEMDDIIPTKS
jgi:hypothetical protein